MSEPTENERTGGHRERVEDQPGRARSDGGGEPRNRLLQNMPKDARRDEEQRDQSSEGADPRDNRAAARVSARVVAERALGERQLGERRLAERVSAERGLLAAVCQNSLDPAARLDVLRRLARYAFADPEHEVIFRALANMPVTDPERARTALGIRITRSGFPDFDLDPFFSITPPAASEFAALFALLEI
jgi:hypothetical protein